MGVEIERKFLVSDTDIVRGHTGQRLRQGYLSTGPTSVRVRIAAERAWLTIKRRRSETTRAEFEYPIPLADANELMKVCVATPIEKVRYRIEHSGRVWEVDVFEGANAPLVVAEVELTAADEAVSIPSWVGREVTNDPRYLNARLTHHPFGSWNEPAKNL
jgi:adenylate cyclase